MLFDPTPCTWQGDVTNALRQLDGFEEAAKRLFPDAEVVKVYGHQGITAETEAEVKKLGIKSIERIGNTYTPPAISGTVGSVLMPDRSPAQSARTERR